MSWGFHLRRSPLDTVYLEPGEENEAGFVRGRDLVFEKATWLRKLAWPYAGTTFLLPIRAWVYWCLRTQSIFFATLQIEARTSEAGSHLS